MPPPLAPTASPGRTGFPRGARRGAAPVLLADSFLARWWTRRNRGLVKAGSHAVSLGGRKRPLVRPRCPLGEGQAEQTPSFKHSCLKALCVVVRTQGTVCKEKAFLCVTARPTGCWASRGHRPSSGDPPVPAKLSVRRADPERTRVSSPCQGKLARVAQHGALSVLVTVCPGREGTDGRRGCGASEPPRREGAPLSAWWSLVPPLRKGDREAVGRGP